MVEYGSLATEFYALDKPEAPPDALDFYLAFARQAGGHIHEPMCGTGRFLLPMAAAGLDVSGSDASAPMLEVCKQLAAQGGLTPPLTEQRLEQLSCTPAPTLVFIPSGSFGLLLDDALVARALRRVYELLAPGGKFLVEAEKLSPQLPETSGVWGGRWVERPDGARLIFSWLTQYSGAPHVTSSVHRYELVMNGRLVATEYASFDVRSYAPEDFRNRLEAAGFTAIQALKPYESAPADEADEAIVFCATKA